jgi:hypothetical protein
VGKRDDLLHQVRAQQERGPEEVIDPALHGWSVFLTCLAGVLYVSTVVSAVVWLAMIGNSTRWEREQQPKRYSWKFWAPALAGQALLACSLSGFSSALWAQQS